MKLKIFSRLRRNKFIIFLAILGPGIIASNAGNDAGGIATYSIAGAREGLRFLWLLFLITFILAIVQEMSARMGVVTGKGLADLIRERFGVKITLLSMLLLLFGNLAVTISEFAGIAASLELFGVSRYISVPLGALLIWALVVKGSYRGVERVMLFFCIIYASYIVSGILAKPQWLHIMSQLVTPNFRYDPKFINLSIAVIGTTIAPWMQFYLQSAVVDKGIKVEEYKYAKVDVYLGSFVTDFIAFFIVVAAATTLYANQVDINSASDAALALKPLAGEYCFILFGIGLLNASILSAIILPLTTAYALSEAFGWESGIGKKFSEAPQFLSFYTVFIIIGAFFVIVPSYNLITIMFFAQTVNGILLPIILFIMLRLINDRQIMGEHVNSRFSNILSGGTAIMLVILTILLIVSTFKPDLF
ncbi:MAG: Mn transporter [Candidatus Schekmanbacteria bacterium GWA2_38_9]|nr:MAG: Mn transporter [Candidatus Schekmanbacteria bacterium GWA2_38_9]OGL50604.1 MAG: Mn transporter [Candidatus Schekmanbacteria bacterium RIFCSPLOWO2_02_FULL_38_14]